MTTIVLAGGTTQFRSAIEDAYGSGPLLTIEEKELDGFDGDLVDSIAAQDPDLLVLGPDLADDDALKMCEATGQAAPHIGCIIVAHPTADLWRLALRAGARDIITPLTTGTAIRESLDRAMETGRRLRGAAIVAAPENTSGRIIAVISPKGGSGKTTVASNLACAIAKTHPDEVVLADLDVQFGDLNHAFRLEPEYSFLNAISPGITPTVLKGFLAPHDSRVLTLTAPDRPEDADDISGEAAAGVVRDLAELFGTVIVDTAAGLDERTLAVLEAATDVLIVSATDVPSVRAAVKEIDILTRLGLLRDRKPRLVLNRADARVGLRTSDIEETIGMQATVSIPSSRSIPTAMNLGEPLVHTDERNPVTRSFMKLAEEMGYADTDGGAGRSWRIGR